MIPKCIYQTWKTKDLSVAMQANLAKLKALNPEYRYELYDDDDIVAFLRQYFAEPVLAAYLQIVPGAFKADFWRYAVLYVFGGIYIDMDFVAKKPLSSFLHDSDIFVSVKDRGISGIFQAFIAVVPQHPILALALQRCIYNITSRKVLHKLAILDATGPMMFAKVVNQYLGRPEFTIMEVGNIGSGVRLLLHPEQDETVVTETGEAVFKTKYDSYRKDQKTANVIDYGKTNTTWLQHETRQSKTKTVVVAAVVVVLLLILLRQRFH